MNITCPLTAPELLDYLKEELAKLGNHATVTIGFDRHAQRPYVHIPSADRPAQINIPIKD